uniref:Uncharacterized protein n=2 Tax=Anopheles atroparvus TaxID=41427 RepID=A0A182J526_ANOAO
MRWQTKLYCKLQSPRGSFHGERQTSPSVYLSPAPMSSQRIHVNELEGVMQCTLVVLLAIAGALVVAQQENGPKKKPASGKPTGASPSLEQLTVERQNEALNVSFAQAFPEDTPEEFQPLVVELYVRCQAELDNCAELLWASHLLREYRKCALTQRRFCAQEIQELQAELEAMVEAGREELALSPAEEDILSVLSH